MTGKRQLRAWLWFGKQEGGTCLGQEGQGSRAWYGSSGDSVAQMGQVV